MTSILRYACIYIVLGKFSATSKATTTFQLLLLSPLMAVKYTSHRDKQTIILSTINYLVCVASVSVWFRSKERPRNGIFSFYREKNGTRASPIFCAIFDSPSSFFARKLHGNACYASEQQVTEEIGPFGFCVL